jgi:RNA polymerase sigma-70 factor (ECF subfamily)
MGREEKVERLYVRHRDQVFRQALRYGDRAFAEDVTHDVFLRLVTAIDRLEDEDDLGGWFHRVTQNRCLTKLKRDRFHAQLNNVLSFFQTPVSRTPEADVVAKDEIEKTLAAVRSLPPKERLAFSMLHLDGKSQNEIALSMGHTKGYVSKVLKRATERVRMLAAVAAILLALSIVWSLSRSEEQPAALVPAVLSEDTVSFDPPSCQPTELRPELELRAGCTVRIAKSALSIEAKNDVRLKRTLQGIHLLRGEIEATVDPQQAAEPAPVVFLRGSRFEIVGAKRLSTHIEEAPAMERRTLIERPVRSPELPPMDAPERPAAQWSAEQTERAVERVTELRSKGQYAEAASLIASLIDAPVDTRTAEVLSFERGEILERKLSRTAEACAHWRFHAARFPTGRYQTALDAALLRCQETSSRVESE